VSVTLTSGGSVQATALYAPYGAVRYSRGTMPTSYGFTHQRLDGSGLNYFHARYYDASLGQFTSADTVQGPNRYAYTGGNPETRTDPTGQFVIEPICSLLTPCQGGACPFGIGDGCQPGLNPCLFTELCQITLPPTFPGSPSCPADEECDPTIGQVGPLTVVVPPYTQPNTSNPFCGAKPSQKDCQKAQKLLKEYERLAQKQGSKIAPDRLKKLNAKRDDGTITSDDLPGSLQREFPGIFKGKTLRDIEGICKNVR
jgi:RHS repeat-associated protein